MSSTDSKSHSDAPKDAILLVDDEQALLDVFEAALSPYFDVKMGPPRERLHPPAAPVQGGDRRSLMPGGNGMSFLVRARESIPTCSGSS